MSPNPLKQIQEALEKVLHETGVTDFGRSVSSIDDLTAEVQHVYKRVDDIEQRMELIVPMLERLVHAAEGLQREIQPISSLAAKVPGSGSRKRRREQAAAELGPGSGDAAASDVAADDHFDGRPAGGTSSGPGAVAAPSATPPDGAPSAGSRPSARTAPAGGRPPAAPGPAGGPAPSGSTVRVRPPGERPDAAVPSVSTDLPSTGAVRPGATGYAPLGTRPAPRD